MNPLVGISLKVTSVVLLVTMASLIKYASSEVPPGEAVFFRSFFAMWIIIGHLSMTRALREGLRMVSPFSHLWRGLMGTTGMSLSFTALALLPLPEATAISYAAPLLVVIFAAMFLGEQVRLFRLTAVALGLLGVLIVLTPRLTMLGGEQDLRHTLGATVALGGAFVAALSQVFVRQMVRTESATSIVFYFSMTSTLLSLLTIPWGWVLPSTPVLAALVAAGLLGGTGQLLMTTAYRHADVSVIAPFEYTSMLLAILFGYVFFSEIPSISTLLGASLVILAGVIIIWRERQLGIDRRKQRSVRAPDG